MSSDGASGGRRDDEQGHTRIRKNTTATKAEARAGGEADKQKIRDNKRKPTHAASTACLLFTSRNCAIIAALRRGASDTRAA